MRADVVLRPARPEDSDGCAAIVNAWIDAIEWMPRVHSPDDVARHYREHVFATREVTAAERAGEVVGFLALGPRGFVDGLYLAETARGQGVGTALIGRAKARHPAGLSLWTFVANLPAQRFYRAQGFTEARRTDGDNEEGLADILFTWRGAA